MLDILRLAAVGELHTHFCPPGTLLPGFREVHIAATIGGVREAFPVVFPNVPLLFLFF